MSTTAQPTEPDQLNAELIQLRREKAQLSMILWETIKTLAPDADEVTIAITPRDDLWQIAFLQAPAEGEIIRTRIIAGTIPALTDAEKKRLVRALKGTAKSIDDVVKEQGLPHPVQYLVRMVADRVRWQDGAWVAAEQKGE